MRSRTIGSDRAASVALNYAITIGIATMLMTGLLWATGDLIEGRQKIAAQTELEVVGERFAANIVAADRLAQADAEEVVVRAFLPPTVAGTAYTISVNASAGSSELVLETFKPEVRTTVPFENATAIQQSTINGGNIRIELIAGTLEVSEE